MTIDEQGMGFLFGYVCCSIQQRHLFTRLDVTWIPLMIVCTVNG